ncbi:MAG: SWIM zinc finger family protein [Verrucomicrobiales bacterium]
MSWYYYSDRYADEERVAREIEKRRKKGEAFEQILPETKRGAVCTTFWGKAWCENLEGYADMENRLPRGRTYLRGGHVYDLEIGEGSVFAYVSGSHLYEVEITMTTMAKKAWADLVEGVAGQIGNLVDLLGGKLGPGAMAALTDPGSGLFPKPKQIRINCNCPDYATLCKHAAAVLYAIGVKFDRAPELFFKLRKVDHRDLIAAAAESASAAGDQGSGDLSAQVLAAEDLSDLFGIEISEPEMAFGALPPTTDRKAKITPASRKKPQPRKPRRK